MSPNSATAQATWAKARYFCSPLKCVTLVVANPNPKYLLRRALTNINVHRSTELVGWTLAFTFRHDAWHVFHASSLSNQSRTDVSLGCGPAYGEATPSTLGI
jgi:hypothetical protein